MVLVERSEEAMHLSIPTLSPIRWPNPSQCPSLSQFPWPFLNPFQSQCPSQWWFPLSAAGRAVSEVSVDSAVAMEEVMEVVSVATRTLPLPPPSALPVLLAGVMAALAVASSRDADNIVKVFFVK